MQKLSVQNCQYLEYRWRYRKTVEIFGFSKGGCTLRLLFIGLEKLEWGVLVRKSFQYKIVYISSTVGDIETGWNFWVFLRDLYFVASYYRLKKNRSGGSACAEVFNAKSPISGVPLEILKNG